MDSPRPPTKDQLSLIPVPYHPDVVVYRLDKQIARKIRSDIGVYLICPPASVRIEASKQNNHLRNTYYFGSTYYFGGTMCTPVAFDCLSAGWQVFEVVPISGRIDQLMYDQFDEHWRKGVIWWGGYDGEMSAQVWKDGKDGKYREDRDDRQDRAENKPLLHVTVNLRAWLEYLPDAWHINDKFEGYMEKVMKRNEEARNADISERERGEDYTCTNTSSDISERERGEDDSCTNTSSSEEATNEAENKKAEENGPFVIGNTYGCIVIVVFGVLLGYWLYLGFIQFCHDLTIWAECLFSSLF